MVEFGKLVGILAALATCSGKAAVTTTTKATDPAACREAYAEYETRWRAARTEELAEFVAGDTNVLEEILFYELAMLPSRVELGDLRDIYAVVDAFLWNAPWPQALAAADAAIEQCGEQAPRPAS